MRSLAAVLIAVAAQTASAQPDLSRAKELYLAAEQALTEGRHDDAVRDYRATYDITKDPVLFYKIGAAYQAAGKCDVALMNYGRYVREATLSEAHLETTRERIRACGGDPRSVIPEGTAQPPTPSPPAPTKPPPEPADTSATGPAPPTSGGLAAPPPAPAAGTQAVPPRNRGAWLMVTGSLAFLTIGSVLAYAAESAENDISDLYVGFAGQPTEFDERTRETYDDLVAEGRRYEKLSWIGFGAAAITAVGAAVLFATAPEKPTVQVAPAVSKDGGGVSATLRF